MIWFAILLIALVVGAVGVVVFVVIRQRKRRIRGSSARELWKAFGSALAQHDARWKVMETEKVLDAALQELGYRGSFADKLRAAGPRFRQINALWSAHKLRNRLAHEMGVQVNDADVRGALAAFERSLEDLVERPS